MMTIILSIDVSTPLPPDAIHSSIPVIVGVGKEGYSFIGISMENRFTKISPFKTLLNWNSIRNHTIPRLGPRVTHVAYFLPS